MIIQDISQSTQSRTEETNFRLESIDLHVPVPELLELAEDNEESIANRNVEEQGCEVSVLQHH